MTETFLSFYLWGLTEFIVQSWHEKWLQVGMTLGCRAGNSLNWTSNFLMQVLTPIKACRTCSFHRKWGCLVLNPNRIRAGDECVLLCDLRFSYLLLWGPAGWSPLPGYLKQLLCTGPHLLSLSTKHTCACVILIRKNPKKPQNKQRPSQRDFPYHWNGAGFGKGEEAEIFFFLPNEFGWTEQKLGKGAGGRVNLP